MQGIVGGVEVEDDLVGCLAARPEKRSTSNRSIAAASWPILW
jgi:hypothetical protein